MRYAMVWSSDWKMFNSFALQHLLCIRHRAGSNASFSARPSQYAQPFSACARAENAPSRSKRPRFREEKDAKLVELKGRRGWSWEDIQCSFPGRSKGSLQVRYSTK